MLIYNKPVLNSMFYFSQVISPLNQVFFADDPILPHDLHPILQHTINVHVPDGAPTRLLFVAHFDWDESLDIVIDFISFWYICGAEIGIKFLSLVSIEWDPIHDVSQSILRFIRLGVEGEEFSCLRMLDLNGEMRQFF